MSSPATAPNGAASANPNRDVVGLVDGSQAVSTRTFHVVLDDHAVVSLDELLVTTQTLPDGSAFTQYGIVVEGYGEIEGAEMSSDTQRIAEARGYHLALVLAHQNLAQLPRDTQLALSANARNKIYFTCAPEDAHQLARHTEPELDTHDLSHLDAYTAAARLVVAGRETAAFTLRTSPPAEPVGQTAAIRRAVARPTPATATAPPAPDAGHAQAQAPARAPGQAGPRRPRGRPDDAGKPPEATENRR